MPKTNIEFLYELNEEIVIKTTGIVGKIVGVYCDRFSNKKYWIRYQDHNGLISDRYFDEDEIKPVTEEANTAPF